MTRHGNRAKSAHAGRRSSNLSGFIARVAAHSGEGTRRGEAVNGQQGPRMAKARWYSSIRRYRDRPGRRGWAVRRSAYPCPDRRVYLHRRGERKGGKAEYGPYPEGPHSSGSAGTERRDEVRQGGNGQLWPVLKRSFQDNATTTRQTRRTARSNLIRFQTCNLMEYFLD